jgi:hypothetical protein
LPLLLLLLSLLLLPPLLLLSSPPLLPSAGAAACPVATPSDPTALPPCSSCPARLPATPCHALCTAPAPY